MSASSAPLRAEGYNGQIDFDGETVTIGRAGWRGKIGHGSASRVVPVENIARIDWQEPNLLTNGILRFAVPGEVDSQMTNDRNAVIFLKKHRAAFEAVRDAVAALIPEGAEAALVGAAPAGSTKPSAKPAKYDDHRATGTEYTVGGSLMPKVKKPIAGTTALFENGADTKRSTLTRIGAGAVLAGPLGAVGGALLRKNTSKCYVTITFADGDSVIVEGPAKDEKELREFAAGVNRLGSLA
ncbi:MULTISPECIES: DUF4429 domain-containing protein [unclassified Leucobacter]|uniref:DUF4429 domain-containing protein n=1 Tax=unclassified Leucobacter TaxID=2621730 RepID=UPI0006224575|nr:DUF4429 domain-containing protein [Leucobacter sp. Ag1]KKI20562.1 hypothetical protein XM48_07535 [Leucobacter sp. Ag1]